jgi:hypothetical protein
LQRDERDISAGVPASALGAMLEDDIQASPKGSRHGAIMNIDLDSVGISPQSRPVRPIAARHYHVADTGGDATALLKERLRLPLKLIIAGMLVGICGVAYAEVTGEPLAVGPVQPLFVAGPLVILGVLIALVRFFQQAK